MPAFSFEKISPPVRRGPLCAGIQRRTNGVIIVQILDRFVEARAGGHPRTRAIARRPPKAPEYVA